MAMSFAEANTSVLLINMMFIKSHAMLVRVKFVRVKTDLVSAILCNISIKFVFWRISLVPINMFSKIHMDVL